MPETVACNLCGHDDAELLFRLRDYRLQVDDVEWSVVRCRDCGLGYLNPRPTREEVARYYPERYFRDRASHLERYRRLARYVPYQPGRLLDIGTARGDFLALMRERGWEVEGIESSPEAGNPHGLTLYRSQFPDECEAPGQSFDVVTAWATFEHLHDPKGGFTTTAGLLRPGGRLVIQVPNLRSIHSRWAKQEDVPRHLYFFTESTLRAYGERAGLELERVEHTTDLFGGSGRGVLRLALIRALGGSTDDFFEIWRTPRRERFRHWPVRATLWTLTAAVERVLLADWIVRALRVSGQIVVEFRKPAVAASSSTDSASLSRNDGTEVTSASTSS
jgi:SAM-dependent methyltransferase